MSEHTPFKEDFIVMTLYELIFLYNWSKVTIPSDFILDQTLTKPQLLII
jgi:hypothetical protein